MPHVEDGPDATLADASPAPAADEPTRRLARARRRRWRRRIGTLLFLLVAVGVFGLAYLSFANDDDEDTTTTTVDLAPTTTVAKVLGPYKVTTGVNVRQGPGTTFATVGTVETGKTVMVECVAEGQSVTGSTGPSTQWLKLTGDGPLGFVTVVYVAVGDDLRTNKIPACPPA
jgi:hypothetical protein